MKLICNYDSPNVYCKKKDKIYKRLRGNRVFFSAVRKIGNPYDKFRWNNDFKTWKEYKGQIIMNQDVPFKIGNTNPIFF